MENTFKVADGQGFNTITNNGKKNAENNKRRNQKMGKFCLLKQSINLKRKFYAEKKFLR